MATEPDPVVEVGWLHADLVLWEDAKRRADAVARTLKRLSKDAVDRPYWQAYHDRMEAHAAILGKRLLPAERRAKG